MKETGSDQAVDGPLESFRVDTGDLSGKVGFDLWQQELVPYWESRPRGNVEERFQSVFESHLFGEIMVGRVTTPAQRIDRSRHRIARDGLSQYGLKIILEGAIGQQAGHRQSRAENPGDVFISDLTQPQMAESSDLDVLFVIMPRNLLAPLLKLPDEHNQRAIPARDPLAQLLGAHVKSAYRVARELSVAQAEAIMKPTLELTAAALNAQVSKADGGSVRMAVTQEIRRYVESQVRDPALCAEAVATRFAISRRKLYYLFQPFGGFSAYVRERRLHHVRKDIVDPGLQHRSIAGIAGDYGFGHYPSFVRAFRRAYDMSPRALRALRLEHGPPVRTRRTGNSWADWFFETR